MNGPDDNRAALKPYKRKEIMKSPEVINMLSLNSMQTEPLASKIDLHWLKEIRGIDNSFAIKAGLLSANKYMGGAEGPAIGFPYLNKEGTPYAIKWRSTGSKKFICQGAPQTFWGAETIKEGEDVVIVEGEIDALSVREAGLISVSVPNCAPMKVSEGKVDPAEDVKFRFVWHSREALAKASKVIIATDNDSPGNALAEEIARRIGKAKCWRVVWPDKDANDLLLKSGAGAVSEHIKSNMRPWPVAGLYDVIHYDGAVNELYSKGVGRGESTGFNCMDHLYTVVPGQVTIVTGVPSSGKSEFVDAIITNLAVERRWKFAICSFENPPSFHIAKLAEKFVGKPFHHGPTTRMSKEELGEATEFLNDHFSFIEQQDGLPSTIDSILERGVAAVQRLGIRGLVIDPFNYIDMKRDMSETQEVSDMLTKVRAFAKAHDVHVWFVAHPAKMLRVADGKIPIPKGYDISGSAAWFSKADVGLTVHRVEGEPVEIHVWKCRFKWVGTQGTALLGYDVVTGRYSDIGFQTPGGGEAWGQ